MDHIVAHTKHPWVRGIAAAVAVLFVAKKVVGVISKQRRAAAIRKRRSQQQPGLVYLHTFPRGQDMLGFSTPCLKVETFLRVAKIPYQFCTAMNADESPTEKLPFIELDGEAVAESQFIIEHLQKKFKIADPLTKEQHAKGIALRRICEDSVRLHFYRHLHVDNPEFIVQRYAANIGYPVLVVRMYVKSMRKNVIEMLNRHGHGDLTDAQYQAEFVRDMETIETLMGNNAYAVGEEPSQYDAAVFAYLYALSKCTINCAGVDKFTKSKLTKYVERVTKKLFPDVDKLTSDTGRKERNAKFLA